MTMAAPIPVVVNGAMGKMGLAVVRAVAGADDIELMGAVDRSHFGEDVGELAGCGPLEIPVTNDLEVLMASLAQEPQLGVMVDFTHPDSVYENVRAAIAYGVRPVVGTTGLSLQQIDSLTEFADKASTGCLIAPNFAIGVILMQQMAIQASKYFEHVEIIELHHDRKADAPSGTALKTAEMLSELGKQYNPAKVKETETVAGARGGVVGENVRVHSIRLPGLLAHQEVIFGGLGQTLTIRHDASDREAYMPGVLLGIRKVIQLKSLVYGLEKIL
ncbi:MAG: 4-hydroxy-tetrahydrodipicolinate reductase [Cyanobacteria bacterium P01_D01_bin.123]